MDPRHRDGLLAVLGVAGLATVVVVTTSPASVFDPRAVATGTLGALVVEIAFLRYPDRLLGLWERRGVPLAAFVGLFAIATVALRVAA